MSIRKIAPKFVQEVQEIGSFKVPIFDNGSLNSSSNLSVWKAFQPYLYENVRAGHLFETPIVQTLNTQLTSALFLGSVLDPEGDVHFIPHGATYGVKIRRDKTVITYALLYAASSAYWGGVLDGNGAIHFVPWNANRGQQVNIDGSVSTYSLVTTSLGQSIGGILDAYGQINFIPSVLFNNIAKQVRVSKVGLSPTVTTYTVPFSVTGFRIFEGAVLAPNGDIVCIPCAANRGLILRPRENNTPLIITYNLIYTQSESAYLGGVLTADGSIHFIPSRAVVGQKVRITESNSIIVSTYSLSYTNSSQAHSSGFITPDGSIHFVQSGNSPSVRQKVDADGTTSTYTVPIISNTSYYGGTLNELGEVYNSIFSSSVGGMQVTVPNYGGKFSRNVCLSPFYNK